MTSEYRSIRLGWRHGPRRVLRLTEEGLEYSGPDQTLQLAWRDVRALVPAGVQLRGAGRESTDVPALGIVLKEPFARPTLVDGALPNLDYAIPIEDLGFGPLLGISVSPLAIVNRAAELARPAGVALLTAAGTPA